MSPLIKQNIINFYYIAAELDVKNFMECNPGVQYVNKEVFYSCYREIRNLLDNSILLEYLRKYDMLNGLVDEEKLVSPYCQLQDRFSSLIDIVEMQGEYGYMILYICIYKSRARSSRHEYAVSRLDRIGKICRRYKHTLECVSTIYCSKQKENTTAMADHRTRQTYSKL